MSRHGIRVSGMNLNIAPNNRVITQKEKIKFTDPNAMTEMGMSVPTNRSAADNEAVTISDVSNKKPVATTRPSERTRCLIAVIQMLFDLFWIFQIELSAVWSSLMQAG
jgi:hypothetical protein